MGDCEQSPNNLRVANNECGRRDSQAVNRTQNEFSFLALTESLEADFLNELEVYPSRDCHSISLACSVTLFALNNMSESKV